MMCAALSPQDLPCYRLRQLKDEPTASQGGLAGQFGVSLGKVSYCPRALVDKGLARVFLLASEETQ